MRGDEIGGKMGVLLRFFRAKRLQQQVLLYLVWYLRERGKARITREPSSPRLTTSRTRTPTHDRSSILLGSQVS